MSDYQKSQRFEDLIVSDKNGSYRVIPQTTYADKQIAIFTRQIQEGLHPLLNESNSEEPIHNPVTGNVFKGKNQLFLAAEMLDRGHTDRRFMMYSDPMLYRDPSSGLMPTNAFVRPKKFESEKIAYQITTITYKNIQEVEIDGKLVEKEISLTKPRTLYPLVYNAQDIIGLPLPQKIVSSEFEENLVKDLIKSNKIVVMEGSDTRVRIDSSKNTIYVPAESAVRNEGEYFSKIITGVVMIKSDQNYGSKPELESTKALRYDMAQYMFTKQNGLAFYPQAFPGHVKEWPEFVNANKNNIFMVSNTASSITANMERDILQVRGFVQSHNQERQPTLQRNGIERSL